MDDKRCRWVTVCDLLCRTGWRLFAIGVLLLAVSTSGFSQGVLFPRSPIRFYSPGYSYWRYADHILSMGDMNRDAIPDMFINACRDSMQTWMIFGTMPGIIDRNNFVRLEGYGTLAKGDVNGDGLEDLLVQSDELHVTMYPGCSTCKYTIDTVPSWRIRSDITNMVGVPDFGDYISIGDLNGDGLEDIAIAAPSWWTTDSGHYELGKIYVYFGGSSKFPQPDLTSIYPVAGYSYGRNGLKIAEVNGDEYKDLIVGSNAPGRRQYYDVYHGGTIFTVDALRPDQRIGREAIPYSTNEVSMWVLNIMDVNNDGIEDIYIGDHFGYVYYGRPGGFRSSPDRIIHSPDSTWYEFSTGGHRIGDINGDGYDDYFLSARNGAGTGMAFIYLGSSQGMESYPVTTSWNPFGGQYMFGREAIDAGDIDGDGFRDFAVTCREFSASGFAVFGGYSWKRTPVDKVPVPRSPTITAFPNPFHDYTTIVTEGIAISSTTAIVFDVFGRELRRLAIENNNFGGTRITWDGRDSHGRQVPSGVFYFVVETTTGLLKGRIVKQ